MKTRDIEANVKVQDENGNTVSTINAKAQYKEPESIKEFCESSLWDAETKLRIVQYGLNTLEQSKLRSQNNFGPIVKKMVEAGICRTHREAFETLIRMKNANQ